MTNPQRNSPTIVIPKNKKQQGNRTCRVSTSNPKGTKDHLPNLEDFAAPLTPHAQIVAELSPLIDRCSNFMDYPIIRVMANLPPHPPIPAVTKKKDTLQSIESIVCDPVLRNALSVHTYSDLIEFVSKHIFRPIPTFETPNEFSEFSQMSSYTVKNWEHVEIVHSIFRSLLQSVDYVAPMIDDEFTQKLVEQLDSPVVEEQRRIEECLRIMIENFVGYRSRILHFLLGRVVAFLDGVKSSIYSMPSILRLFLNYFTSLPLPLKQNNFLMFRTVFYPLFSKDLSYHFEEALHELSSFFQEQEPATALWCLHYLKRHWPRASTSKQMMFLHQLMHLLPTQPATVMEKVGPLVLKTIAPCIISQNFRVAATATSLVSDPDFIGVYKPMPDAITEIMIPAAKMACEHWNEHEREMAIRLLDQLKDFHFRSKPATRAVTATQNLGKGDKLLLGWKDIIEIAAMQDPSINVEEEEAKLESFSKKWSESQCISS